MDQSRAHERVSWGNEIVYFRRRLAYAHRIEDCDVLITNLVLSHDNMPWNVLEHLAELYEARIAGLRDDQHIGGASPPDGFGRSKAASLRPAPRSRGDGAFWARSAVLFLATVIVVHAALPFLLNRYIFNAIVFNLSDTPDPPLRPFVPVTENLVGMSDVATAPNGAYRVDYLAKIPVAADGTLQKSVEAVAADHCRFLKDSIAQTCRLEAVKSPLRIIRPLSSGPPTADISMTFLITRKH